MASRASSWNQFNVKDTEADKITRNLISIMAEERRRQGLTYEELADRAGVHRTTIALWEREERTPSVQLALKLAAALNLPLSRLLSQAEAVSLNSSAGVTQSARRSNAGCFRNEEKLRHHTGFTHQMIAAAMEDCYNTLDLIDEELMRRGAPPFSQLVELANLSSMIGNLLAAGLVQHSNGAFRRNTPHTYPDLVAQGQGKKGIEIKTALERNKPKGHLPKPGVHLTFRYVLASRGGEYSRGKETRGASAFIWEVKVGNLRECDFDVSNTDGDSGKTAVINTKVLNEMPLIYYDPGFLPYAKVKNKEYPGFN